MTREEYIDFANALKNNYTIDLNKMSEFCDLVIDSLKGGWIKCTEDMELPNHEVLVCDKYGEKMIGWLFRDEASDTGISAESEREYCYDVVAYMKLPEPYREVDHERG